MKIAFFDSGIGGLTVLREAVKQMPDEKYVYCTDSANAPYGDRTKEEVLRLTLNAVGMLGNDSVKALVVACNTATSIAIDTLRERFRFPVVGMEPAVKTAVDKNTGKKILVLATPLTLREAKFNSLIKRLGSEDKVEILPLQHLVYLAENFVFSGEQVDEYLLECFKTVSPEKYSSIVLGCTHFSFYREQIKAATGGIPEMIDGTAGTIRQLKKIINGIEDEKTGFGFELYVSGRRSADAALINRYLDIIRDTV